MIKNQTKFKETEIGPIPEEWDVVAVEDVVNSVSDTFKFTDKDVVFLNTSDIYDGKILHSNKTNPSLLPGQAKKKIQKNDILFSEIRPANRRFAYVGFDTPDYVVSTKLMVLRAKNIISPKYFYTYITNNNILDEFQVLAESRSGTFPQITFEAIGKNLLALPPKLEQEKIADFILDISNKIELNHQINANLEKLASSLFKQWFIDFEFPDKNGKPYKSSGGKMIDSELGKIPEGWKLGKLKELVSRVGIKFKQQKEWLDKKIIDLSIMPNFSICIEQFNFGKNFSTNINTLKKYDLLYGSIRPYFGKVGFSPIDGGVAGTVFSFLPKDKNFYSFVLLLTSSKNFIDYTVQNSRGTKMPIINWGDLVNYGVVMPKLNLVTNFNDIIFDFIEVMKCNIEQNLKLSETRDSLLPRLMSGKIRVKI